MAKNSGRTRGGNSASRINDVINGIRGLRLEIGTPSAGAGMYKNGIIKVSQQTLDAVKRLQAGGSDADDYVQLLVLFHELNHATAELNGTILQADGPSLDGKDAIRNSMEVMNEIRSRALLGDFAKRLGITPQSVNFESPEYRQKVGYYYPIKALNRVINALGANKQSVYNDIVRSNEHSLSALSGILANNGGIKRSSAEIILQNALGFGKEWLDDQELAVQRKFGRGARVNAQQKKEAMIEKYGSDYPNLTKPYDIDVALDFIKKRKKSGNL